ncbi:MAG: hypothetical protein ABUS54_02000 [Actinomycetota bacterium]
MSNPVVVDTPSGPIRADRAAVEWLWEMLDSHELPVTHAALGKALNGENLDLPEAELDRFAQALRQLLGRLDPASPHAPALQDLVEALAAA